MMQILLRLLGGRLAHRYAAPHVRRALNLPLGFALMRDRRVPFRAKALALALGAAITAALVALELPLEAVWTVLVPFLGPFDVVTDGLEVVLLPLATAALLMPYLAPQETVEEIGDARAEGSSPMLRV